MSLQAIFDPMVRAYFKNLYGGSGGGSGGETNAFCYDKTKTYETALFAGGFPCTKISDITKAPGSGDGVFANPEIGGETMADIAFNPFTVDYNVIPGLGALQTEDYQFGMIVTQEIIDSENEEIAAALAGFTPGLWLMTPDGTLNCVVIFNP